MQRFDTEAVKRLIGPRIQALPRGGQSELARLLHVEPQTVNKWAKQQTMPSTDHWEAIERYLGLEPGEMVEAAGFGRRPEFYRDVNPDSRTTVDLSEVLRREEPIRLSASGVDLDELLERDPEAYAAIMEQARIALDRARERRWPG